MRPNAPARGACSRRRFDTPGGLKVQTIHAFCTKILQQFPFEADVAARFTVLEERAQDELLRRLILDVLLQAAGAPDTPLGGALKRAVVAAAETTFLEVFGDALAQRGQLLQWLEAAGGIEAAVAQLAETLGIDPDDDLAQVEKDIIEAPHLPCTQWASTAAALDKSSKSDQDQAERLAAAAAASGEERLERYFSVFVTGDQEKRKRVVTGGFADLYPELAERLAEEQERVLAFIERRNAVVCRDRTAAAIRN